MARYLLSPEQEAEVASALQPWFTGSQQEALVAASDAAANAAYSEAFDNTTVRVDALANDLASTDAGKGADMVGFLQSGTGAVARTLQDKGRETVTDADFDTPANAAAAAAALAEYHYNLVNGDKGKKYRILAGVLRNDGTGWKWINDASHTMAGFTADPVVRVDGYNLDIDYGFTASKVLTFIAAPDETFQVYGYRFGASVGLGMSALQVSAPLHFYFSDTAVAGAVPGHQNNITAASADAGASLLFTHPLVANAASGGRGIQRSVCPWQNSGLQRSVLAIENISQTTFKVYKKVPFEVRIGYNGASFDVTSAASGVTAAFAGNTLTITHPATDGAPVVAKYGSHLNYSPVVLDYTGTTTRIVFDTGAGLAAAVDTKMQFTLVRGGLVAAPASGVSGVITGPPAVCYWDDIVSAGGNIWIIGIMEID